jgi:pilus assembly protein CpaE
MARLESPKTTPAARETRMPEKYGNGKHGTEMSNRNMAASSAPDLSDSDPGSISAMPLSIAVISPSDDRRAAVAAALAGCPGNEVTEFSSYPPGLDDVPRLLEENYDVIIIELDSDPEYALEVVEGIDDNGPTTVIVSSDSSDPELLVRCMRAGAREFLMLPLSPDTMAEALVRAAARRSVMQSAQSVQAAKTATGKLLAFMGAKGGAGTTMLACNFAVALATESEQNTLLIDLDLPLGDAALNLGITPEFSTIDALAADERLDGRFLAQLLVKHSSGLSMLAAPGKFVPYKTSNEAVSRLLNVARQEFEYVVVDLGSRLDLMETAVYKEANTVYLVTQASIPELRNSHRLISQFFAGVAPKLEIVINRFESHMLGVTEEHVTKALTRPAQWKIPNDYATVQKMQIEATPLVLSESAIARQIRQMVQSVSGKTKLPEKKKKKGFSFNLFG